MGWAAAWLFPHWHTHCSIEKQLLFNLEDIEIMKKILATLICLVALSVAAVPAGAQTPGRRIYRDRAAQQRTYYDYNRYDNRSFWEKHRDKITTVGGGVGGAILGGIIGGKKGAAIGAISGAGAGALYTYKMRNRYPRY